MRRSASPLCPAADGPPAGDAAAAQALIDETVRAYDARYAAAVGRGGAGGAVSEPKPPVTGGGGALAAHVAAAGRRRDAARSGRRPSEQGMGDGAGAAGGGTCLP